MIGRFAWMSWALIAAGCALPVGGLEETGDAAGSQATDSSAAQSHDAGPLHEASAEAGGPDAGAIDAAGASQEAEAGPVGDETDPGDDGSDLGGPEQGHKSKSK